VHQGQPVAMDPRILFKNSLRNYEPNYSSCERKPMKRYSKNSRESLQMSGDKLIEKAKMDNYITQYQRSHARMVSPDVDKSNFIKDINKALNEPSCAYKDEPSPLE